MWYDKRFGGFSFFCSSFERMQNALTRGFRFPEAESEYVSPGGNRSALRGTNGPDRFCFVCSIDPLPLFSKPNRLKKTIISHCTTFRISRVA